MANKRAIHNWYSERAKLLQEISMDQPIATDWLEISFMKSEGDHSVMRIRVDFENGHKKLLRIPITDNVLDFSMFERWLTYINLAWCCGSASVTVGDKDNKFTISLEPVIYQEGSKFKNMINDVSETAYFYVYSSKKQRIVLSAYIDSFIFFSHFGCVMEKFVRDNELFKLNK